MQIDRTCNSAKRLLSKVEDADRVNAIRETLMDLKKLTADEREFRRLNDLIGRALEEARAGLHA